MQRIRNEIITATGLRLSMPVPGIVRVTDGAHKDSYMVSAAFQRAAPVVTENSVTWGKITVEPENGMALYYDGKLVCVDYSGPRHPRSSISPEEAAQLSAEGHISSGDGGENNLWKVEVVKTLTPDAVVYGLGDKTGFLNKRHYAYENWNTDDPNPHCDNYKSLYKSINFFYGLFRERMHWHLGG